MKRRPWGGSYIIEAQETGRVYRGHFNLRNHGCISNLATDSIIEAPGYVDKFGIHRKEFGDSKERLAEI